MDQLSFYDYTITTSTVTNITDESLESKECQLNSQKGGFWKRVFRKGYNSNSSRYNGIMAKTDPNTSRSKLNRFLDKHIQ